MRLAKLVGLPVPDLEADAAPHADDPMAFLDDIEAQRRRRARR
jgi:hypothetical protein